MPKDALKLTRKDEEEIFNEIKELAFGAAGLENLFTAIAERLSRAKAEAKVPADSAVAVAMDNLQSQWAEHRKVCASSHNQLFPEDEFPNTNVTFLQRYIALIWESREVAVETADMAEGELTLFPHICY